MGFEMAPSLRDVSYILGIPVNGHVVTAEPISDEGVNRMFYFELSYWCDRFVVCSAVMQ